jgi:hypothetical protein
VEDLVRFDRLGRYVVTDANVISAGQNSGGDVLLIGGKDASVTVFLPRQQHDSRGVFRQYRAGDRVRIVGLSSQYCVVPPFERDFQLLVATEAAVTLVSRGWLISPNVFLYLGVGLVAAAFVWWRRLRGRRLPS